MVFNKEKKYAKDLEVSKKIKAEKSRRNDFLFLGFALLVIFIVLFWILQTPPQQTPMPTYVKKGNIEDFKESLLNAEYLLIIENVTGIESDKARYVYACGAGLAGSWGKIGKNISNLYTFVFDGNECTYSSPRLEENEISHQSTVTNTQECMKLVKQLQNKSQVVTFEIKYGTPYSIYETNIAYIFVNANFTDECSFRIVQSEKEPGTLVGRE